MHGQEIGMASNIACRYITPIPRGMPTWTTILQNVKNNHIIIGGKFLNANNRNHDFFFFVY